MQHFKPWQRAASGVSEDPLSHLHCREMRCLPWGGSHLPSCRNHGVGCKLPAASPKAKVRISRPEVLIWIETATKHDKVMCMLQVFSFTNPENEATGHPLCSLLALHWKTSKLNWQTTVFDTLTCSVPLDVCPSWTKRISQGLSGFRKGHILHESACEWGHTQVWVCE